MNNILFVCIGDSNIVGDSLGPLIGTFIQKNKHIIQTNSNINEDNETSDWNRLGRYERQIRLGKRDG